MRNKRGMRLITLGLLMIVSAAVLSVYNLFEEYAAGEQAQQALEVFEYTQEQARPNKSAVMPSLAQDVSFKLPQAALDKTADQQHEPLQASEPTWQESAVPDLLKESVSAEYASDHGVSGDEHPKSEEEATGEQEDVPGGQESEHPSAEPAQSPAPVNTTDILFPQPAYDEIEIPDYILNPNMEMPVKEKNGQSYIGVLEIPSLGLTLPVISEWNYARLKKAPCRYAGSAYTDDLVIAAHNYKTHFGTLKKLRQGDLVSFTDAAGNRFNYAVVLTETLMPNDVQEMKSGEFALSLFTCTVGGSYRITVRCDRIP